MPGTSIPGFCGVRRSGGAGARVWAVALLGALFRRRGRRRPTAWRSVVVWPTLTPAGDEPSPVIAAPAEGHGAAGGARRAQELDATPARPVQDLGFTSGRGRRGAVRRGTCATRILVLRASDTHSAGGAWVVSARLEHTGGDNFVLRIVAVPPKGRELRVRTENVKGADVAARRAGALARFALARHGAGRSGERRGAGAGDAVGESRRARAAALAGARGAGRERRDLRRLRRVQRAAGERLGRPATPVPAPGARRGGRHRQRAARGRRVGRLDRRRVVPRGRGVVGRRVEHPDRRRAQPAAAVGSLHVGRARGARRAGARRASA